MHNSNKKQENSTILISTEETRNTPAFVRRDTADSTLKEWLQIIVFGFGCFAVPLRILLEFCNVFVLWVVIKVVSCLHNWNLISERSRVGFLNCTASNGVRFGLLAVGFYWINKKQVPQQVFDSIVNQVRDQSNSNCTKPHQQDMQQFTTKPPFFIIANHNTIADPMIALSEFGLFSVLAKAATQNWPIVGLWLREAQSIFTQKKPNTTKQDIKTRARDYYDVHTTKHQYRMLIYPEGTICNGTSLIKFHEGAFAPGVPVQIMYTCFPTKSSSDFHPSWSGHKSDLHYLVHLCSQIWVHIIILASPIL